MQSCTRDVARNGSTPSSWKMVTSTAFMSTSVTDLMRATDQKMSWSTTDLVNMSIVPACGPQPNDVLLCGEAPGRLENARGLNFVGPAGVEQEMYLNREDESARGWRLTNVVQQYFHGDPDPTLDLINTWTPMLLDEVFTTSPGIIIAVGKFAVQWFLGDDADLFTVHGIVHRAGAFDPSRRVRGGPRDAFIIPIFHPAAGFRRGDMRARVWWDYQQVAKYLKLYRKGELLILQDAYPDPWYEDVTGKQFADLLNGYDPDIIGLDTEDDRGTITIQTRWGSKTVGRPWSIQISPQPGVGLVLRYSDKHFMKGIEALQRKVDAGMTVVAHGWMHDLSVCRAMKLDLSRAKISDTMYGLYLLRTERQGLKRGAYRLCAMRDMRSYSDTIGPIAKSQQERYLRRVVAMRLLWSKIKPFYTHENDGTVKKNSPWQTHRRAYSILRDSISGKRNKDGELTDIVERWEKVLDVIRLPVERELGPLPIATLADLPLSESIPYAGRDPDATLRVHYALIPLLERLGVTSTMHAGMRSLPMFEAMQDCGLPANKEKFLALSHHMDMRMAVIQARISHLYFNGNPFNPGSSPQTAEIMEMHGLKGTKKTKTGAMSTGKDSIHHLRYVEDVITDIFEWRECAHTRDFDCAQALRQAGNNGNAFYVKASLLPTGTVSRRLAAKAPNVLAITKHGDFGELIRKCYEAPEGKVLFSMDLSQIEVCIAASISGDETLCKLIREGADIHTQTAMSMFNLPMDQIVKELHRLPAKTTFFGGLFGQGAKALANEFLMLGLKGWTVEKCRRFQKKGDLAYPGLTACKRRARVELTKTGLVKDVSGMVRHLPGIWSEDNGTREESGREAFSHWVQGDAQTAIQNSMGWAWPHILDLWDKGVDVRPMIQVHDSLDFITNDDPETRRVVQTLVHEALTQHHGLQLKVPVRADGGFGRTWAEL